MWYMHCQKQHSATTIMRQALILMTRVRNSNTYFPVALTKLYVASWLAVSQPF